MNHSWIILVIVCIVPAIHAYTYVDASNLFLNLTSGYEKRVRPDAMTNVTLDFGLMSISEVNTVTQEFALMGFLIAEWTDSRLAWNPSDYGNMDSALFLTLDIWAPSLLISNAADAIRVINDDSDLASIYSYLFYDGTVKWLYPVNVIASCDINIAKYPFDSQSCDIIISSWMFSTFEVYITKKTDTINTDLYSENGEWGITSTSTSDVTRELMGFPMSAVSFTVDVERKYNYYVMNMILPIVLLAFLGPFVFLLQIESGEQNGYSLTVLLSMSVVMTTVSDSIPPTANHVCILSVYLLTTYVLSAVETVLVVVMTRMFNYTEREYKPGRKTLRVVRAIAKATFYRRADEERHSNKVGSAASIVEVAEVENTWTKKKMPPLDSEKDENNEKDYSFQECVYIINFFNFVLFSAANSITILIFMFVLRF